MNNSNVELDVVVGNWYAYNPRNPDSEKVKVISKGKLFCTVHNTNGDVWDVLISMLKENYGLDEVIELLQWLLYSGWHRGFNGWTNSNSSEYSRFTSIQVLKDFEKERNDR